MNAIEFFQGMNAALVRDIVLEIRNELLPRFTNLEGMVVGVSHRLAAVERGISQLKKENVEAVCDKSERMSHFETKADAAVSEIRIDKIEVACDKSAVLLDQLMFHQSRIEAVMLALSNRVHQTLQAASQEDCAEESMPKRARLR
jgi:hypothetical protein